MAEDVQLAPSRNVAPGQDVLAVRLPLETRERSLDVPPWGLNPRWAKDKKVGHHTLNARSESVDPTPAFRPAFRKRRCLVCADGFHR
jgi:putative SOS response-associated peptidase YedK